MINTNFGDNLRKQEKKEQKLRKAIEMGLFPIGTEVLCDCPEKCGNIGIIKDYHFLDEVYYLTSGCAYFDYARKLTKLEKALR